jgi:hypothetical protein
MGESVFALACIGNEPFERIVSRAGSILQLSFLGKQ